MGLRTLMLAGLALLPAIAPAQTPPAPKLIVAISVDQYSADLFAEYRQRYTAGLKRLEGGVVFPSGYQSHAATETCPGHSTILTGSHPARTGIVANNWFDLSAARSDKKIYCAEDETKGASSSTKDYYVSPIHLKAQTLGDRMKQANPASRVVSVAGKDRAAVMMGGHHTDAIWYLDPKIGDAYVTLPDRPQDAPAVVREVNARVKRLIGAMPLPPTPRQCAPYARPITAQPNGSTVGVLTQRDKGKSAGFRTLPEFDAATADIAIGLVRSMKLGQGAAPDLLAIGLSANDYVGHAFGTEGAEMCVQQYALDATVGRILAALDATRVPYVVMLTADHGGHDLPERNRLRGMPEAARVDPALTPEAVGTALAQEFALPTDAPLLYSDGPFGDFYLAKSVPDALRPRVLAAAKARLLAFPQVAAVLTAEELRAMPSPQPPVDDWTLAERARASFDGARSGDLVVLLKPRITPIANPVGYVATHGSPWDYDRRVPILFYQPGRAGFEQPLSVETVDIMPTLAGMIGLTVPKAEIDGRCLDIDVGEGTNCPAE